MANRDKKTETAIVRPATNAIDKFSDGLTGFLEDLGLPSKGVLTTPDERFKVFRNLPDLVHNIDEDRRGEAMYISKFVAACGAGLFDAALNFIWDEVVVRLRGRIARFDLAYFFDTAVPDTLQRLDYKDEDDLRSLSDAALVRGALKCGMLTDIGYKHLDYIREMRNWASAAHPNHAQLTGLQLISWCETCVREVILPEPEGEVLEVGRLLRNLREQTLSAADVPAIAASIRRLPDDLAAALLRSSVGHYCDPRQDVRVRDNIRLVAEHVWQSAGESARGEVGLRYANYSANADLDRKKHAHDFLNLVGGLSYLPESDLALEISARVADLETAHEGFDNFYNEPPKARELRKYIAADGLVPAQINDEYVRVVARCRIGRTQGVSRMAAPVYDELIGRFGEPQIRSFVHVLAHAEIAVRLENLSCANRFREIATKLRPRVIDRPLQQLYDAMTTTTDAQLPKLWRDSRFQRLVAAL